METLVSTSVGTDYPATGDTNITHSNDILEHKHKVFLSHSGMQKVFVEQLCIDLEICDRYPFFDKRRSSLPIGMKFPRLIFDAIRKCHVGVLILSKEFFTKTKWPMLELVAMVRETEKPNPSMNIIPVFYNLSREEFLDQENRSKWRSHWEEWASDDKRISIEEWKMALNALKSINSLMMKDGEVNLRREIVDAVCKLVLPETKWDDAHVQGRSRLCEILIERISKREQRNGNQVMGLYGIGGIGKTTISKAMCNELFQKFRGRVCHVELNSASEIELLRDVWRKFTDLRLELLGGLTVDKCWEKLKGCITEDPVFLAIDNLSDTQEARKQVQAFLGIGWGRGSVVIVTARSLGELTYIHQYIRGEDCIGMPELEEGEATSLFLNHVASGRDSTIEIDRGIVSRCVERCGFSKGEGKGRHYIPLALEVLGEQLGCLGCNAKAAGLWEEQLKKVDIFEQELSRNEHPIFSILRSSYNSLSDDAQMLFMDAALFLPSHIFHSWSKFKWDLFDWLSMIHGSSTRKTMRQLEGLKQKSLLENWGGGRTKFVMHDLWREFCVAETKFGKFKHRKWVFLKEESSKLGEISPSGRCWENLKRMCFLDEGWKSLNGAQLDDFLNVLVLKVDIGSFILPSLLELDLKGLKHLKSLELKAPAFQTKCTGLGSLTNLTYLSWTSSDASSPDIEEIGHLTKLQVLYVHGFNGDNLPDMSMLTSLRLVSLEDCCSVVTVAGLSSKLSNLQYLNLSWCWELQECPGLGELYALEELDLCGCYELKEVSCLRRLTRLRRLNVSNCRLLRAVPGLSDLVALECLLANDCYELGSLLDLQKLTKLKTLKCNSCPALKSLSCTEPLRALEEINLALCTSLEEMPDLSNFPQLQLLFLAGCTGLMRLSSSAPLYALLGLSLEGCSKLTVLPDHLSGSADLRELHLQNSGILLNEEEIRELEASCEGLVVFPSSARSKYGIVESGYTAINGPVDGETEMDDMEINEENQCQSRRLPDSLPRDKVMRLIYTNTGCSLLALTSNGIIKLWQWGERPGDPRYQATVSSAPQLRQPASGILMINDMDENEGREEGVPSLALPGNNHFVISASGGKVSIFDIHTFELTKTLLRPPPAATSLALYPHDNSIIAIGMEDSTIQILEIHEYMVLCTLVGHQKRIIDLAFSKSTSVLVSLGADAQLCVWKVEEWSNRQSKFEPLQPDRRTPCVGDIRVQFHQDQRHILVVGESQLAVYDALELDRPILQWVPESPFTAPISDATFSCDGRYVYAGFADGYVCQLITESLKPRQRFTPPIHPPLVASGSPTYLMAIAAHPKNFSQFALGMSDGSVLVVEPLAEPDNESSSWEASASAAVVRDDLTADEGEERSTIRDPELALCACFDYFCSFFLTSS